MRLTSLSGVNTTGIKPEIMLPVNKTSDPSEHFRKTFKLTPEGRCYLFPQELPPPVTSSSTGQVHAGFFAETEDILHGYDHRLRRCSHGKSHHLPVKMRTLYSTSEIPKQPCFIASARLRMKPSEHRVAIMGSCIRNRIFLDIMGRALMPRQIFTKGKKDRSNSGKP